MITLGIEEEVQVVDPDGELVPHDFSSGGQLQSTEGMLDREIHRCVIELKTRICHNVEELIAALGSLRRLARQRAAAQGQQIIIAGMHPTARWQAQSMHEDGESFAHYARLIDEYQDVARSAFSFGMHLHLGFAAGTPRVAIMDRLRHVLPQVLALSASSPFFEGRDTGLQSWRHSLLDRYPRMGTPDVWGDEQAYQAHLERLRRIGCLRPDQGLWQDIRLHHTYGTLEVRIMDSHPDLTRIALIATLLRWEAQTLELELRSGRPGAVWTRACIDENKWRARRHGLAASWIDWDRDRTCDSHTLFAQWWSRIACRAESAIERAYWERQLADALDQGSFAQALRRRAREDGDWRHTLRWMMDRERDAPLPLAHAEGWR